VTKQKKPKSVLITSVDNQAVVGTVYSIREAFYSKIIGIDRKEKTIAQHMVDVFVRCLGDDDVYINRIKTLVKKYGVTVIVPHSIRDRLLLMKEKQYFEEQGVIILSSSIASIELAENKDRFAELCKEIGIPIPKQYIASTDTELLKYAKRLGYPKRKVIVKPVISHGSRGFRILNEKLDLKTTFYTQRAESTQTTIQGLLDILGTDFPSLIVSEYLPGKEYSIDCLRHENGDYFYALPRTRDIVRMGVCFAGHMKYDEQLISYARKLSDAMELTTVFGFQFKKDGKGQYKIIECNPRIQGSMVASTLAGANLIGASLQYLLKGKRSEFDIDWDFEFYRTLGGIGIGEKKKNLSIDLR
jgi:carbamoyl-phosphate synthase large subunit